MPPPSPPPASPSPSRLPPIPSSPVCSVASTANPPLSQFNLPLPPPPRPSHAVLTKADLSASQRAYSDLVASAKSYRLALSSLSTAASRFGASLEACARLKEARAQPVGGAAPCTADTLLSASGLHHLVANHHQILSETVYRAFEVPLLHDLDRWQTVIDDEEATYQARIRAQSREVKRLEKEGLRLHRQRRRDLARFRAHLVELTGKLDGLTTLHADHARALLRESQETSGRILDASCSLVRAEVDIFEGLARKGWTGGGLEDLLEKGVDLFARHEEEEEDGKAGGEHYHGGGRTTAAGAPVVAGACGGDPSGKLFSILPPRSILADAAGSEAGSVARGLHGHARGDSLLVDSDRYQSLAGLAAEPDPRGDPGEDADADAESLLSADLNRRRGGPRPFSPQPIRRLPQSLGNTIGGLSLLGETRPGKKRGAGSLLGDTRPGKKRGGG